MYGFVLADREAAGGWWVVVALAEGFPGLLERNRAELIGAGGRAGWANGSLERPF